MDPDDGSSLLQLEKRQAELRQKERDEKARNHLMKNMSLLYTTNSNYLIQPNLNLTLI